MPPTALWDSKIGQIDDRGGHAVSRRLQSGNCCEYRGPPVTTDRRDVLYQDATGCEYLGGASDPDIELVARILAARVVVQVGVTLTRRTGHDEVDGADSVPELTLLSIRSTTDRAAQDLRDILLEDHGVGEVQGVDPSGVAVDLHGGLDADTPTDPPSGLSEPQRQASSSGEQVDDAEPGGLGLVTRALPRPQEPLVGGTDRAIDHTVIVRHPRGRRRACIPPALARRDRESRRIERTKRWQSGGRLGCRPVSREAMASRLGSYAAISAACLGDSAWKRSATTSTVRRFEPSAPSQVRLWSRPSM